MHELFGKEGANKNVLWSLKLSTGRWDKWEYPDPFQYIPPEPFFDLIGWTTNDLNKPEVGLYSKSLESSFNYYYKKATNKYKRKPQIIWELSSHWGPKQDEWVDEALTSIKNKYFRVKGVSFDENCDRAGGLSYWPIPTNESKDVIRKHFSNQYYIGSIIKK